jgi:hypothetical protein
MKRIQLLTLSLLICSYLMAQQKKVSEIATIKFPSGTEKLTDEQLRTLRTTSKSPILSTSWKNKVVEHYQINSFFLELYGEHLTDAKYTLEDNLKDIELLNKQGNGTGSIVSGIKKINNYRVFIAQVQAKDWAYYSFFTLNDNKTEVLNGMLHYDPSDSINKDQALTALNEFLQGITFK